MNVLPPNVRVFCAVLMGIAAALLGPALRADAGAIGVRYRATVGCPSELDFLTEVRRRNPRVAAASEVDPPQLLVTITEGRSPRFSGRLERVTSTGTAGVREIGGESCREITTALALITALTADVVASSPPLRRPEAEKPRTSAGEPEVEAAPPSTLQGNAEADQPKAAPPTVAGVNPFRWQTGAGGMVVQGITPSVLAGATLFVQVSGRSSATWVPSVRLSVSVAQSSWSSSTPGSEARASFVWAVASLDGCPLQLGDPLGLSVQPCIRLTAGVLSAEGDGRETPHAELPFWSDIGGAVRGHWQLTRALFLDADGGVFVPRVRHSFEFTKPSETAYIGRSVGFRFGAGLGLVFR